MRRRDAIALICSVAVCPASAFGQQSIKVPRESQGACRESATSNRHRYPITRAETVGVLSVLQSLCRTQNDALWYNALPHEPPQGDQ